MRLPLWVPLTFLLGCPAEGEGEGEGEGNAEPVDCERIAAPVNTAPFAVVREPFVHDFGVNAPATLSLIGGELPPGLAIDGTTVVGTPTNSGDFFAELELVSTAFGERSECTPTQTRFAFNVLVYDRVCNVDDDCFAFFGGDLFDSQCSRDIDCDSTIPSYCVRSVDVSVCIADEECSGGRLAVPFVSVDGVEFTGCSVSGTCTGGLCVRN